MVEPILTDRFLLGEFKITDVELIQQVCNSTQNQRYMTTPYPYSLEDAKLFVEQTVPNQWVAREAATFAIRRPQTDELLGCITLRTGGNGCSSSSDFTSIGWWATPEARGLGVIPEAAQAAINWALNGDALTSGWEFPEVIEWDANANNIASGRVAMKLGFKFSGFELYSEVKAKGFDAKRYLPWSDRRMVGYLSRDEFNSRNSERRVNSASQTLAEVEGWPAMIRYCSRWSFEREEFFDGLRKHFDGWNTSEMLDKVELSPFQRRVLEYVATIEFGETRSYSEVARALAGVDPKATSREVAGELAAMSNNNSTDTALWRPNNLARAALNACANNPFPLFIPCHRVVCATFNPKTLENCGGYIFGKTAKRNLLALELSQ